MFAWLEGRWDEAVELYDKGRQLRIRIGDEVDAATGTHNIAEVLSDQGRLDEARALFEESLRVWRAAEFGIGVAYATSSLGQRRQPQRRVRSRGASCTTPPASSSARWCPSRSWSTPTPASPRRWCSRAAAEEAIELTSARWSGRLRTAAPRRTRCCTASAATRCAQRGDRGPAPATSCAAASRPAESRNARYEVALTLDAIARVAEARGRLDAPARAEADELFAALGVVFVPTVLDGWQHGGGLVCGCG